MKARIITDYKKDVDFIENFVFELWLLNVIVNHPEYAAIRIKDIVDKKMRYYTKNFSFKTL